jgi:hypothetical protein
VDENTREIEREIIEEREELGDNLRELQDQARALTDWRRHYRNHTGAAIAVAFSSGVALGLLSAGIGRGERFEPDTDTEFDVGDYPRFTETPRTSRNLGRNLKHLTQNTRAGRQVSDLFQGILDALIGVASGKAVDLMGDFIPGFRHEFENRRGPHTSTRLASDARH